MEESTPLTDRKIECYEPELASCISKVPVSVLATKIDSCVPNFLYRRNPVSAVAEKPRKGTNPQVLLKPVFATQQTSVDTPQSQHCVAASS